MTDVQVFEILFVIFHHGSGLVDRVHHAHSIRFEKLAFQTNVVDFCLIVTVIRREMNGKVMHIREADHSIQSQRETN